MSESSIRDRIAELITGRARAAANYNALQTVFNHLNQNVPGGAPGYLEGQNMPMRQLEYAPGGKDPRELIAGNIGQPRSDYETWLDKQSEGAMMRDLGMDERGDI